MDEVKQLFDSLKEKLEEKNRDKVFLMQFQQHLNDMIDSHLKAKENLKENAHDKMNEFLEDNKEYIERIKNNKLLKIFIDYYEITLYFDDHLSEEPDRFLYIDFFDHFSHRVNKQISITVDDYKEFYLDENSDFKTIVDVAIEYYKEEQEKLKKNFETCKQIQTVLEEVIKG